MLNAAASVPEDKVLHDDSQKTDVNAIALERNSLNFLECASFQRSQC